jgi:hypothetical protein
MRSRPVEPGDGKVDPVELDVVEPNHPFQHPQQRMLASYGR